MGDVADDMVTGLLCQVCGTPFPDMDAPGYPRTCSRCSGGGHTDGPGANKSRRRRQRRNRRTRNGRGQGRKK